MQEIRIGENEAAQRIDRFVKKYLSKAPLGLIFKYLRTKKIRVNGKKVKQNYRLKVGDMVQFNKTIELEDLVRAPIKKDLTKYEQQFGIIYEDEHLLVVDKPSGLLVHSNRPGEQNTLNRQVLSYLIKNGIYNPEKEKTFVPGPSNRLDRNTSGLVLFGKDYPTQQTLNEMIKNHYVNKYYLALVYGELKQNRELKGYLTKDKSSNVVMISKNKTEESLPIHTRYRILEALNGFTLLEVELITGRSHQIRAHLSTIGHPIIGDPKYGNDRINQEAKRNWNLHRQFLHAYCLTFTKAKKPLDQLPKMIAPLPHDLEKLRDRLSC
ncbi:MAG: RluA family pseudouridine synthase [Halanaerobiales bacterium]|nr:RluA family pseudouridine synthase [Halanaerobiales bacterium]